MTGNPCHHPHQNNDQNPNFWISTLEMTPPLCLRLKAISLQLPETAALYPTAQSLDLFLLQGLEKCWGTSPAKPTPPTLRRERSPDSSSNDSTSNLIWNRVFSFLFANEMIHLTKHSELEKKHSPWRRGISSYRDVGPKLQTKCYHNGFSWEHSFSKYTTEHTLSSLLNSSL